MKDLVFIDITNKRFYVVHIYIFLNCLVFAVNFNNNLIFKIFLVLEIGDQRKLFILIHLKKKKNKLLCLKSSKKRLSIEN